jgi:hypothetical protein
MLHVELKKVARAAKRIETDLSRETIRGLLTLYRGLLSAQEGLNGLTLHPDVGVEGARILAAQYSALQSQIDLVATEALCRHPAGETEAHQRGMIVVDAVARYGAWREVGNLASTICRETADRFPSATSESKSSCARAVR